jgi:putative endopeptidase
MVEQIRTVLIDRINTVPWLTEATRKETLKKAQSFRVKIGYPDKWHDYSSLHITPGPFITQRMEALHFESARLMKRIGAVPEPAEWDFQGYEYFIPQSPTAWANWTEIIFPAAYLQSPLVFDSTADMATNYGSLGTVIAHEMTHLFTADGGDIDAQGRIRHWWTAEDSTRFATLQRRIINQYDDYTVTVLDSAIHVNGTLTIDENLADLGGLDLAYAALERSLTTHPRRVQGDTTPEVKFFLGFARGYATKSRPEYLRQQLASDGHAPESARVNVTLSNSAAFAKAFGCKSGDPMVRPDSLRVHVW